MGSAGRIGAFTSALVSPAWAPDPQTPWIPAAGIAPGVTWRTDTVGDQIELVVLASTRGSIVGIDTASGALLRATYDSFDVEGEPRRRPRTFDIARGIVAPDDSPPDESHPEAVMFATPVEVVGTCSSWRAERLMRALEHPDHGPLLGLYGPSVPFYELQGDRPSMTLVKTGDNLEVRMRDRALYCRFRWQHLIIELPFLHASLRHAMATNGWGRRDAAQLQSILGFRTDRLVIGLSAPHNGFCHKVVASLIPRA
jgi:hypothetical protein